MQQRSIELTRDNLFNFLDFAGEKGLLKRATAKARKDASRIVLRILDGDEAANLSKVDLEGVITRHRNLAAGKIMPRTLSAYESRVRVAVTDFLEYAKNPSTWRPSQQRTRKSSKATLPKKPETVISASESRESQKREGTSQQPSVHIDLQIHISPEATPEQIEHIFASMRRHLYGSTVSK